MSSRWLRLMVFDLDYTLWPFHVDSFTYSPPYRKKGGLVVDSNGEKMDLFPDTLQILEQWSKKCEIAVASRTTYPQGAESLLDLFGLNKYIKYKEIYPGSKHTHFNSLLKRSRVEFREMLFFDDEFRNIKDIRKIGVESVFISDENGVNKKMVDEAVAKTFHVPK